MGELTTYSYTRLTREGPWTFAMLAIVYLWAAPVIHLPNREEISVFSVGEAPVHGWSGWTFALTTATALLALATAHSPSRISPLLILLAAPAALLCLWVTVITATAQQHATIGYATYLLTAALLANTVMAAPAYRRGDIPMPSRVRRIEDWDHDNGTGPTPSETTNPRRYDDDIPDFNWPDDPDFPDTYRERGPRAV
ncbi:hypothetical protein Aph01nite_60100 [Acrocarpospora phusangensis]|uniref:Uncharacterized protein n=1 Tax=Acrocarpospora phusangensis TaxID=1070424 RepID=A0A919QJX8_9ACTN|nr:hypothetical protein [Acrocarpospora phusangensis]GIH27700.1 hypothetical protein Aph01nite_60100 [Acrocarpospora phusangensis]